MNLIEIAEDLKDVPDQYLMQEIQQPTGNFPAYLVVSELSRRKRMREKVAKEMPTQTVAEELATPPQPQMPQMGTMMPQAGLMGMPQAQTELAAQDAMGTTPPEMMMPTQQMAGGGMVSFKQGGDVIRAFDGLPEEFFTTGVNQPSISREELTELMTLPELQQYNRTGVVPERLRSRIGTSLIERGSFIGGLPLTTGPAQFPSAVTPAAVTTPTTTPTATPTTPAPEGTPAPEAPPAGPTIRDQISQVLSSQLPAPPAASYMPAGLPAFASPEEIGAARARKIAEFEQAVPDRATPFFQEDIARRERDIEGRRESNINEALIQAGLGIMGSKSPRFLGAVSEGGTAGLNALRQGRKDIMQSEEALRAARAKMIESQMLRDQGKFAAGKEARAEAKEDYDRGLSLYNTVESQKYRQASLQSQNYQTQLNAALNQQRLAIDALRLQREAELDPTRKALLEAQIKQAEATAEAALRGKAADPAVVAGLEVKARTALGISLDEYKNDPNKRKRVDDAVRESLERQGFAYPGVSVQPTLALDRGNM